MRYDLLKKVSDLGDPTLLLLAGFGVFFCLWSHDSSRAVARNWAVAFGLCIFLTIASKVFFYLVGPPWRSAGIRSPSGHVAIATTFYGCCAMLLTSYRCTSVRMSAGLGVGIFVCVVAVSRFALGMHTLAEITVGFVIGILCLVVFAVYQRRGCRPVDARQLIALLLLLVVTRFARVNGEEMIAYGTSDAVRFLLHN